MAGGKRLSVSSTSIEAALSIIKRRSILLQSAASRSASVRPDGPFAGFRRCVCVCGTHGDVSRERVASARGTSVCLSNRSTDSASSQSKSSLSLDSQTSAELGFGSGAEISSGAEGRRRRLVRDTVGRYRQISTTLATVRRGSRPRLSSVPVGTGGTLPGFT